MAVQSVKVWSLHAVDLFYSQLHLCLLNPLALPGNFLAQHPESSLSYFQTSSGLLYFPGPASNVNIPDEKAAPLLLFFLYTPHSKLGSIGPSSSVQIQIQMVQQ